MLTFFHKLNLNVSFTSLHQWFQDEVDKSLCNLNLNNPVPLATGYMIIKHSFTILPTYNIASN